MDFSVSQDINFFAYGLDFYHLQQKKDLLTKSQKWFNLYIYSIAAKWTVKCSSTMGD